MDCDYISFPENIKSKKAKKLIRKLLSREPHKRMKSFGKLKANKVFNSIDWVKIYIFRIFYWFIEIIRKRRIRSVLHTFIRKNKYNLKINCIISIKKVTLFVIC